jgi:F0F1-type ATP synthase membrane subunit b/b'
MERERELTPEERFTELVLVREKEKELKRRLEEAQARAQEILAHARERATLLKAQAAQELQHERERRRAEARAAYETEVHKILAEGRAAAHHAVEHATARLTPLWEKLRQELFFE